MFGTAVYDYLPYGFIGLLFTIFEIYFLKRWGQTIGKMVMGIQVVKTDLSKLAWKEVLLRTSVNSALVLWNFLMAFLILSGIVTAGLFLSGSSNPYSFPGNIFRVFSDKIIVFLLFWWLSEIVVLLTNPRKRALHDFLAGTIVIVKKRVGLRSALCVVMFLAVNISFYYFFLFKNDCATSIYAEKGDPTAQLNLGSNYYQGWFGKPKDYGLALKWFQKAADQGNGMAQYYIGEMYELGLGVKEDQAQAIHWYSIAANNGERWAVTAIKNLNDPEHQVVAGYSFYKGHFRTHDFKKAFNCFQRAASQGNADAQGYLGEMYEKGEGVTKDKKMAANWYIKAANNGNKSAKYALERLGISIQK